MIKNRVRSIREKLGYTQAELAAQTNLSVRTIQRVESGRSIPKGHTLQVLSRTLGIDKIELRQEDSSNSTMPSAENLQLKLINLSSLCFIGIPFGNIIIPFLIWEKNKGNPLVNEVGRKILNFQVIWTLCTSCFLIGSPFFQEYAPWDISLILWGASLAACINIYFIIKTALSLMRQEYDILPLNLQLI